MFEDSVVSEAEFVSSWKVSVSTSEHATQTESTLISSQETQTHFHSDTETQTDVSEEKLANFDVDKVNLFLNNVMSIVQEEMALIAATNNAFGDYLRRFEPRQENLSKGAKQMGVLKSPDSCYTVLSMHPNLSWVAVGSSDIHLHSSWCEHSSSVMIWSLNSRNFDPNQPNLSLESLNSCVSSLQFNPFRDQQQWLAVAQFNGNITIYNLDLDKGRGDILASNNLSQALQEEKITNLLWLTPKKVISSALDGSIVIWSINSTRNSMECIKKFAILPHNLLLLDDKSNRGLRLTRRVDVGVTCFDVNKEDDDVCIVGTEAGAILQCSLSSEKALGPSETLDPFVQTLLGHRGRVLSLKFMTRELFVSSGSDNELQLHSLLQPQAPLSIIMVGATPIVDIVIKQKLIIALDLAKGCYVIDLDNNKRVRIGDNELINDPINNEPYVVYTGLAMNNRSDYLALGKNDGEVELWRIHVQTLFNKIY